jgi:serine/threonine protein kinase
MWWSLLVVARLGFAAGGSGDPAIAAAPAGGVVAGTVVTGPSGSAYVLKSLVRYAAPGSTGELLAADTRSVTDVSAVAIDADGLACRLPGAADADADALAGGPACRHDPSATVAAAGEGGRAYRMRDALGRGANGAVWRARRLESDGSESAETFVVKHLFSARPGAMQSGYREVHFGLEAAVRNHTLLFTSFVEHWATSDSELWLVFHDAGLSLQQALFTAGPDGVMQPSAVWRKVHDGAAVAGGSNLVQLVAHRMLRALSLLHAAGITHRDVKPGNVLLGSYASGTGRGDDGEGDDGASGGAGGLAVRLGDFGSAVDAVVVDRMYPPGGPSHAEETLDYAPPEVRLHSEVYDAQAPSTYDVFSLGVLLLEVVTGQPPSALFTLPPEEQQALERKLQHEGLDSETRARYQLATGLAQWCISPVAHVRNVTDDPADALGDEPLCGVREFARRLRAAVSSTLARTAAPPPAQSPGVDVDEPNHAPTQGLLAGRAADLAAPALPAPEEPSTAMVLSLLALVAQPAASDVPPVGLLPTPTTPPAKSLALPFGTAARGDGAHAQLAVLPANANQPSAAMQQRPISDGGPPGEGGARPGDAPPVPALREEGEALLYAMLRWDPRQRPTAAALLQHPFFAPD